MSEAPQEAGARAPGVDWKAEFSRFHAASREHTPGLLHFAAHSHHFWPDVTLEAQQQAWRDAAARVDTKWEHVFGEVVPAVRGHIARTLDLSGPATLALAPNTHELVVRLFSCFAEGGAYRKAGEPVRILSTDGEFHSFRRQAQRWEEAGLAIVERVPTRPFETFEERFCERAAQSARGGDGERFDLVFTSHVFFDSGLVVERPGELAAALPAETFLMVDAYHGFMALPTSWRALEDRAFYLAGCYKYAMAGEGACFLHCPPGWGERPMNTGWYAEFGELQDAATAGAVPYAADGNRFFGATFDPAGLYRFRAVMDRWKGLGVGVEDIHARIAALQDRFLAGLAERPGLVRREELLLPDELLAEGGGRRRAHFLTFERDDAAQVQAQLREAGVLTDVRGDRLRFGFGVYVDEGDVDELLGRLAGPDRIRS